MFPYCDIIFRIPHPYRVLQAVRVHYLGLPSQDVHKVGEAVRPGGQGRLKVDRRQGGRSRKLLDAVYVEYLFLGNSGKCIFFNA